MRNGIEKVTSGELLERPRSSGFGRKVMHHFRFKISLISMLVYLRSLRTSGVVKTPANWHACGFIDSWTIAKITKRSFSELGILESGILILVFNSYV